MYIFDTQKKPDPRKTNRPTGFFSVSYEKLRGFQVSHRVEERGPFQALSVWTRGGMIGDLVDITRGKFMEAIKSNTCLSTAVYRRCSSVRLRRHERFQCYDFSKLPTQTGIPRENVGFLSLLGVKCGGACVAMRSSKKPWPRYSMPVSV